MVEQGEFKSSEEGRSGRDSRVLARKRGQVKGRENKLRVKNRLKKVEDVGVGGGGDPRDRSD